jgi:hypothetical protein
MGADVEKGRWKIHLVLVCLFRMTRELFYLVLTTGKQHMFLGFFLSSSVPRNITHICSSVPKPMKVNETDEYMPGMFVG